MWSVQGKQVVHSSGLSIEVVDGTFANPMNLSVRGDNGLSAPQLALLIREGLDYAASKPKQELKKLIPVPDKTAKPKRPILKLKK
jgi:hypothetical protein